MTVIDLRYKEVIASYLPRLVKAVERIADNMQPKETCCICGCEINGYGNNSEPIAIGKCCDKCNQEKVIPERIRLMKGEK